MKAVVWVIAYNESDDTFLVEVEKDGDRLGRQETTIDAFLLSKLVGESNEPQNFLSRGFDI